MNNSLNKKTILFLGATIYFYDACIYAQEKGAKVIALDYYDEKKAVTKKIADYSYDVSVKDVNEVERIAREHKIDGIYAGASEVSIPIAIELSKRLNLPYYCDYKQWEVCTNKRLFKDYCMKHNINVSPVYTMEDIKNNNIQYPVVTKPTDNNGSTGITICHDKEELERGIKNALDNSTNKTILIEQYMPYDSVIIHYTAIDGEIVFCGMSDKKSKTITKDSAPIMAEQCFPAESTKHYVKDVNTKATEMLKDIGITNGPIWIESFVDENNNFIFNEIGHRYGGSMTNYAVEYMTGIDQVDLLLNNCVGNRAEIVINKDTNKDYYFIVPLHLREGKITAIEGIEKIKELNYVHRVVTSHVEGDIIKKTGTVSQVFGYLHLLNSKKDQLDLMLDEILNTLKVFDEKKNILFCLMRDEL